MCSEQKLPQIKIAAFWRAINKCCVASETISFVALSNVLFPIKKHIERLRIHLFKMKDALFLSRQSHLRETEL